MQRRISFTYLSDTFPCFGGRYPAVFARSLAAFRRSSLYGSRINTHFFGTVYVMPPLLFSVLNTILSGYFSASRFSFFFSFGSWVYTLAVDSAPLYSTKVSSSYFDSFIASYPGQIPDGIGQIRRCHRGLPTHHSSYRFSVSTARSCTPACRRAASSHDPLSA